MDFNHLKKTAEALVVKGKGILAADESTSTAGKRLALVGAENNKENRGAMREMFFSSDCMSDYISGVILYDETLRQNASTGQSFVDMLTEKGVIPGIKVDLGLEPFGDDGEMITLGLDDLAVRLAEYYELGARFAKWRAVVSISGSLPTVALVDEACERLAKYAKICQEYNIVPMVEPEVLLDDGGKNNTHSLRQCADVISGVHEVLFLKLKKHNVYLEGLILKPSMVTAGSKCSEASTAAMVAKETLSVLECTVPKGVAGVAFLSGGQSDEDATRHLSLMNEMANDVGGPRALTFSYGRALQTAAIKAWGCDASNIGLAQKAFEKRARLNSLASRGLYKNEDS